MEQNLKKTCNSCFEIKNLTEFSKQKSSRDGYKYRCKVCDKRYFDKYYEIKKPQIMQSVKNWQEQNHNKVLDHKKKYRDKISLKKGVI